MENHWILTPFALDEPLAALQRLARPGWHVNVPAAARVPPAAPAHDSTPAAAGRDRLARMCPIHEPLVEEVARASAAGKRPVSIAGDCCAPIAALAGLQRAGVAPLLVWLDAHGDFNTHETTLSGYVAGMSLAMITGRGDQTLLDADGLTPLADERVILADARDLDPLERELLARSAVTQTGDLDSLPSRVAGQSIHVHLDVDVIDAAEAPATLFPVAGGPGVEQLRRVLSRLRADAHLVSVSMTPWAFDRDTDGRTAAACWRVLDALVGED